jgi:hypothetical protein
MCNQRNITSGHGVRVDCRQKERCGVECAVCAPPAWIAIIERPVAVLPLICGGHGRIDFHFSD